MYIVYNRLTTLSSEDDWLTDEIAIATQSLETQLSTAIVNE